MPNMLKLAPYIPVSQGHTMFKPWWNSTLCCGVFDLALAAHIKTNTMYNNVTICKLVDVLLDYATTDIASDGKVYTHVGEFFSISRFEEFISHIIELSNDGEHPDLELFKTLDVSHVKWDAEPELDALLKNRGTDDLVIFPYEPAYRSMERKGMEKNFYNFLHFGLVLPEHRDGKYHVVQTSRGRTVKKPVYRPMRLVHNATSADLYAANLRPKDGGYKWLLQFPWKSYKGKTDANFSKAGFEDETLERFSPYDAIGEALLITTKQN